MDKSTFLVRQVQGVIKLYSQQANKSLLFFAMIWQVRYTILISKSVINTLSTIHHGVMITLSTTLQSGPLSKFDNQIISCMKSIL